MKAAVESGHSSSFLIQQPQSNLPNPPRPLCTSTTINWQRASFTLHPLPLPCPTSTNLSLVRRLFTFNHHPIRHTRIPSRKLKAFPPPPYTLPLSMMLPHETTTHLPQIIHSPPSTLTRQPALPSNKRSPSPKSASKSTNMILKLAHESRNLHKMSQLNTAIKTMRYGQVVETESRMRRWPRTRSTARTTLSNA